MTFVLATVMCAVGFSQAAVERGVYAPLLEERYHGVPASQMVVKDSAGAMPSLRGSSSEWLKQFEGVPSELRRAASRPSPTKPRPHDPLQFPSGARLVSARAVEAIFSGRRVYESWEAFSRQFKARGWLAFSDALLTGDRLHALVYYEAHCPGLCGEGGYVWLRRDTVSAPWGVARKIPGWFS